MIMDLIWLLQTYYYYYTLIIIIIITHFIVS